MKTEKPDVVIAHSIGLTLNNPADFKFLFQEWYEAQTHVWDLLVEEGWKFAPPPPRYGMVGLRICKNLAQADFYIPKSCEPRVIHSFMLAWCVNFAKFGLTIAPPEIYDYFPFCLECYRTFDVMLPEKFLDDSGEVKKYFFCSIAHQIAYTLRVGYVQVDGVYQLPGKWVEDTPNETREKIKQFLDKRCTCRENWKSGLHFQNDELPRLIEDFMFWFDENQ